MLDIKWWVKSSQVGYSKQKTNYEDKSHFVEFEFYIFRAQSLGQ